MSPQVAAFLPVDLSRQHRGECKEEKMLSLICIKLSMMLTNMCRKKILRSILNFMQDVEKDFFRGQSHLTKYSE